MAPASNEEQFKFLISCIRYSNNGKVDFGQVAKECKIVSKGAAAKRYERMMKSHGIAANAAAIKPPSSRASSMKTERRESGSSATKKRKTDSFLDEESNADDDEGYGSNIKAEPSSLGQEQFVVKEEEQPTAHLSLSEAANLIQYYDTPDTYGVGASVGGHMGVDKAYNGGGGGAGGSAFATSIGSTYGLQTSQPFDFSMPYGQLGLSNMPKSENPSMSYQPMMQYSAPSEQGRFDSPVVLE